MKTTVELPDGLVREVKALATTSGVTMRALIVDGLRNEIDRRRAVQRSPAHVVFPTFGGGGLVDSVTMEEAIRLSYRDRGGE